MLLRRKLIVSLDSDGFELFGFSREKLGTAMNEHALLKLIGRSLRQSEKDLPFALVYPED